jgi:cysteine desulfurase
MSELTHCALNGDAEKRYPGCVNISFAYVEGESLLMACKDIALSSGSACTSASLEPSYVLRAIGADEDLAHSSIRFGIGRFTTQEEVDFTAQTTIKHVKTLREMRQVYAKIKDHISKNSFSNFFFLSFFSPLWEMVQEGIDLKSIKWTQH